jgi:bifunctional non-homologous end joining protein LigD
VRADRVDIEIDGRRLSLSNLDKVLYPASGFTKGQVIDYYARIAEVMVPHIADRPITLKRYPDGIDGFSFFEKHALSHLPPWVRVVDVPSRGGRHEHIAFAVVCDRPTLLWAANLASLEFHVPLWRVGRGRTIPAPPDYTVFDLDPGPGTSIVECCTVARWIAADVGEDHLFAKTSGSKGLQLYMRAHALSWEEASLAAHELAQRIERAHPDAVVSNMRKSLRAGKVLIDWSQNSPSKTTVAVYSLRARTDPTVSTPVSWREIDACQKSGVPNDLAFDAGEVLRRVESLGDLMAPLLPSTPPPQARGDGTAV